MFDMILGKIKQNKIFYETMRCFVPRVVQGQSQQCIFDQNSSPDLTMEITWSQQFWPSVLMLDTRGTFTGLVPSDWFKLKSFCLKLSKDSIAFYCLFLEASIIFGYSMRHSNIRHHCTIRYRSLVTPRCVEWPWDRASHRIIDRVPHYEHHWHNLICMKLMNNSCEHWNTKSSRLNSWLSLKPDFPGLQISPHPIDADNARGNMRMTLWRQRVDW